MFAFRHLAFAFLLSCALAAQQPSQALPPDITGGEERFHIPRIQGAPKLDDFEGMQAATPLARQLHKIDQFVQRDPHDGAAPTQRTEAYLGYNERNFYIVFLAFDSEPSKLRARMMRREQIDDDDQVGFYLDTFHDRRHAYAFYANAYGIQQDALFTENQGFQGFDGSFDTVWRTEAKITREGYMVLFEIPFRSLRFPSTTPQAWGIMLVRVIPRNSEHSFYPRNTNRVQGWLTQTASMEDFKDISPGRNLQFIPYTSMRAFRALDTRDPNGLRFTGKHLEAKAGLDAKVVLKDSLVLDTTVNPDFGQVESDDPQVTVNQRFEVFFPEKRPFFQENSNYFHTPLQLVFTRRIVDPLYGVRLSGKAGPWAIGALIANDQAPGKSVLKTDPLSGNNAYVGIVRINREIGKNNSLGLIYTDRELHTDPGSFCAALPCLVGFNRVGGFDTQMKFGRNWQMNAQAVTSETRFNDGTRMAGPAYHALSEYTSRSVEWQTTYRDISPGFASDLGFIPRTDIRRLSNFSSYTFRPEKKALVAHGPRSFTQMIWDHQGNLLSSSIDENYEWNFQRQSFVDIFANFDHERLRPVDFPALPGDRSYAHVVSGVAAGTQYFKWLNIFGEIDWGTATNFVPRNGPPVLANQNNGFFRSIIRPVKGLTIENSYIYTRLTDRDTGLNIFNNHILRSKWNYQFTREFSFRLIGQYTTTLANPGLTFLQNTKNFNGDVLFAYMLHPGTAIYVGYNSNLQNLDPSLAQTPDGILRTRSSFINDGRQVFIKLSYVFRY